MSRHKYGAIATTVDGIRFASKAEAARYVDLKILEKLGHIKELELQPKYPLYATQGQFTTSCFLIGHYLADFRYRQGPTGVLVIEDVKGMRTALYNWKKKHFEAQYGLTITEIGRPRRGAGRRTPLVAGQPGKAKSKRLGSSQATGGAHA